MRRIKVSVEVIEKDARGESFGIERRIDLVIRDTTIIWDRIGDKHVYAKYDSNRNRKLEFSWPTIVLGMVKDRATQG